MADVKISELTALTSPDGAEELVVNDGGTTKKITITNATSASLAKTGGTMTGDTAHGDNVKSKFGTGNDLEIYHDGGNSRIKDVGTGSLIISGSLLYFNNAASNENMISATENAAVKLYYNGAQKLATTATGIDVTGQVVSDGLTVDGRVVVYDTTQTMNGGISTEANAAIINFGLNEGSANRFGGSYTQANQGGMLNFDTRAGQPLFQIYTRAAGTAAATGTASFNIDSAGNVGIGVVPKTFSGYQALQLGDRTMLGNYPNDSAIFCHNGYASAGWKYIETAAASRFELTGGGHRFQVAPSGTADAAISWTTAMTIDNAGNVDVGSPLQSGGRINVKQASGVNNPVLALQVGTNATAAADFYNGSGGHVGAIRVNSASVAYETSSDYRLKTDVQPMTGAADRVKLLKPCNFEWISDGTRVDGFLAHEAQEVVPEAVTGTKDAMRDEDYEVTPAVLDDEGNETTAAVMGTRSVPDMQGIDQAKLVPLLTATIQELIARIEALEA